MSSCLGTIIIPGDGIETDRTEIAIGFDGVEIEDGDITFDAWFEAKIFTISEDGTAVVLEDNKFEGSATGLSIDASGGGSGGGDA